MKPDQARRALRRRWRSPTGMDPADCLSYNEFTIVIELKFSYIPQAKVGCVKSDKIAPSQLPGHGPSLDSEPSEATPGVRRYYSNSKE
jgi:hypothetical protein